MKVKKDTTSIKKQIAAIKPEDFPLLTALGLSVGDTILIDNPYGAASHAEVTKMDGNTVWIERGKRGNH